MPAAVITVILSFISDVQEAGTSEKKSIECWRWVPSSLKQLKTQRKLKEKNLSADVWFFPRAFFNSCGWWKPGKDKNISDQPSYQPTYLPEELPQKTTRRTCFKPRTGKNIPTLKLLYATCENTLTNNNFTSWEFQMWLKGSHAKP